MAETTAPRPPQRAILYIDGNNWYHFMTDAGVRNPGDLCYAKMTQKLVGPREWKETRYYIGALKQDWNATDYAAQRAFLAKIRQDDPRVTVHLGRLERRFQDNPLAAQVLRILDDPTNGIPRAVQQQLRALAKGFNRVETLKEKAVDVMLARDLLVGAMQDEYDCAYLLSADGDFTPVVESAKNLGKKVFCASPGFSSELNRVANAFIKLDRGWFDDCYR